jgi:GrpB-like predicted nucleotidyltransferase (UPF0157 family)
MAVNRISGRWSNAEEDRVEIVPYDPTWPEQFAQEASALRNALGGSLVSLHHIGSTSVPGLDAKPILDIMLELSKSIDPLSIVGPLEALGYVFWRENPDPTHLFFVKGMPPFGSRRTHHTHVFLHGPDVDRHLAFRDLLRATPRIAALYAAHKRELATRFPTDRDAYTKGKTEFIAEALSSQS